MLDKLESIVPHDVNFRKRLQPMLSELRNPQFGPFRGSPLYRRVLDLRPSAMLHLEHRRYGTHKIELLEAGKKPMSQLLYTLEGLVDCDPLSLRVSRIDPAVDVPGVPLTWFRDHVIVQFNQWLCAHGKLRFEVEFSEMGKKVYQ